MASVSLAEPRRRQKWTLNPRGNLWANDENKFGHKLMEKMGWEKGKGLGAKQTGMVTHVKIKQKDNQKGVGFEGHDDTWLAHQDDFQAVLAALNVEHGAAGEGLTEMEKKASMEAISRKSKRRVHYQKFVKGKDSSNYSAEDLGCILGTKSDKVGAKAKVVEEIAKEEEEDTGKFTQAVGSYQDYFATKMAALKAKGMFSDVPTWTDESTNPRTLGLGAAGGRAVDREVERDSLLNPQYLREAKEVSREGRNTVKERQEGEDAAGSHGAGVVAADCDTEAETEEVQVDEAMEDLAVTAVDEESGDRHFVKRKKSKKDKNRTEELTIEKSIDDDTAEQEITKKKKKSKKNKREDTVEEVADTVEILDDSSEEKQKKKKSKKHKHDDTAGEVVDTVKEVLDDSSEEKQKKKKSKKSKKEKVSDEEKEAAVEDSGCEEMEVKAKKVKKSKKEKSKELVPSETKATHTDKTGSIQPVPEQSLKRKANDNDSETRDEPPSKKKKSKKKAKLVEEEVVSEDAVLNKDYREAPGGFKGSNLMAIPGYGNTQ